MVKSTLKAGILPELLGKRYSSEPISSSLSATDEQTEGQEHVANMLRYHCKKGESGEMIGCEDKH